MKNILIIYFLFILNCFFLSAQNDSIKVLWTASEWDPVSRTYFDNIELNKNYFESINDAEKAIVGLFAFMHGNECMWDSGFRKPDRSNLKCILNSALSLGYQCSDIQMSFLKNWFRDDTVTMNKFKKCPTISLTSTIQDMIDEMYLTRLKDEIIVSLTITEMNILTDKNVTRRETHKFLLQNKCIFEITGH